MVVPVEVVPGNGCCRMRHLVVVVGMVVDGICGCADDNIDPTESNNFWPCYGCYFSRRKLYCC